MAGEADSYEQSGLAGWQHPDGDWFNVQAGDRMPTEDEWEEIEVTRVFLATSEYGDGRYITIHNPSDYENMDAIIDSAIDADAGGGYSDEYF